MNRQAFEVASLMEREPGWWTVTGRAYVDIAVGDRLWTSPRGGDPAEVVGIESYGRSTDLLSAMMTGALQVVGPLRSNLDALYVADQVS